MGEVMEEEEGEVGSTDLPKHCLHCVSGKLTRRDDISVWVLAEDGEQVRYSQTQQRLIKENTVV